MLQLSQCNFSLRDQVQHRGVTQGNVFLQHVLKGEVIRATNCYNLQRNIVDLQVEKPALLHILPPTSNIVTQQNFVVTS